MPKLECGICRLPFIKEYFGDDPIAKELFTRRNDIDNISVQTNINNFHNQENHNNNASHNNELNLNEININVNINNSIVDNNFFIIKYKPNKFFCIFVLICDIFICGSGTFICGIQKFSGFYLISGIIQFFGCYLLMTYRVYISDQKKKNAIILNNFYITFLIIEALFFYFSSIFFGLFLNFIRFNPNRIKLPKKRLKGLFVFFCNVFSGGTGYIIYSFSKNLKNKKCGNRICCTAKGVLLTIGFLALLKGLSYVGEGKLSLSVIIMIVYGSLTYLFCLILGVRLYRVFNNS